MSTLHDFDLTNCWYSFDAANQIERWFVAGADPSKQGIVAVVSTDHPYILGHVPGEHGRTTLTTVYFARACLRSADGSRSAYDAASGRFSPC